MLDAPIGIFDSGSGGLSIFKTLVQELPHESFVYLGDHANLPYADKEVAVIQERVFLVIEFLISKNVKSIVIACNTATVAGIDLYRSRYSKIPILGVVPVVKTAAEKTTSNKILVLSTPFTAKSEYQKQLIKRFASGKTVYSLGCPDLVPIIEKGKINGHEIETILRRIIIPYIKKKIDIIVLGCTHYPFLLPQIHGIIKKEHVLVMDSSGAVMRQLKRVLFHNNIEAGTAHAQTTEFYTTGDWSLVSNVATLLLKRVIHFHHVDL